MKTLFKSKQLAVLMSPGFGRAYAQAFANGRFELIAQSGHNPQLEQPVKLMGLENGLWVLGRKRHAGAR